MENVNAIYFDMDGTLADFYSVEGWLEFLQSSDPTPYREAVPLLNMNILARRLNRLQKAGYKIGIISWLSKESDEIFSEKVTAEKLRWLKNHLNSVKFNEIKIVPYGVPKHEIVENPNGILFDDERKNRREWTGQAYDENQILEVLKSL